jgi:hypothetical protein
MRQGVHHSGRPLKTALRNIYIINIDDFCYLELKDALVIGFELVFFVLESHCLRDEILLHRVLHVGEFPGGRHLRQVGQEYLHSLLVVDVHFLEVDDILPELAMDAY